MLPTLALAALLVGAHVAAQAGAPVQQVGAAPNTYTVTIEQLQFNPATLTVHRGDRIVWVNKDLFPHTATATGKTFDSRSIGPGASWAYVARTAGDYAYGCTFHPTMKGHLVIQ